jgi:hypothetical protein
MTEGKKMEKYENIIEKIRKLQFIQPPDDLAARVMNSVTKIENSPGYRFIRLFYQPLEFSKDIKNIISGQIASYKQCAFLLFVIGLFYFFIGFLVMWGLHDALQGGNINSWLRIQPYIAVASAVLIIILSLLILLYSQKMINIARYIVIIHIAFIAVDAIILESVLFSKGALLFTIMLTTAAIILGFSLINYLQNFRKNNPLAARQDCDQNA